MCRLFAMSGGQRPVRATFWLLDAADSLAQQSRSNPDGFGIATFAGDGTPEIEKRPVAAIGDEEFARAAREESSTVYVAHVRHASTGTISVENTHPFALDGRVFAHNGHVGGLDTLDERLGPDGRALVRGQTDSERVFALITTEVRGNGGDIEAGIETAVRWIAANLPLFALNFILATATTVWALRYPETHPLLILERGRGGPTGARHLDAASPAGTVRVRSGDLAQHPAVILATEQMDEDPGWRALAPGALVRIDPDLSVTARTIAGEPPAHQLTLEDLDARAAAAQAAAGASSGIASSLPTKRSA